MEGRSRQSSCHWSSRAAASPVGVSPGVPTDGFQLVGCGVPLSGGGEGGVCPLEGEEEVRAAALEGRADAGQGLVSGSSHEASRREFITRRTWHIFVFKVIRCSEIQF